MSDINKIAIVGATGFGGLQLIRLLKDHPQFEISFLGGDRSAGSRWNEICPFMQLEQNPPIESPEPSEIAKGSDFVILSLPNGIASNLTPLLLKKGLKVLDLSADYRFRSLDQWNAIYSINSSQKREDYQLCKEAVYGLPELNFNDIAKSKLVACPGCFPTASLLALIPFLRQGLIDCEGLIIDAKSGTSGGGRVPKEHLLFAECAESISPYGVIGHRHTPEIEQISSQISGKPIQLQFTPHLVPMVRGILSTVYARLRDPGLTAEDCNTLANSFYRNHPFVEVLPVGTYPSTKWVKQTNKALLSLQVDKRTGGLVIMCVIDNLIKGQAGQAIQNLNIMAGLPQETGLPIDPFYP